MPFIILGVALFLLYRHYSQQQVALAQPGDQPPPPADDGGGGDTPEPPPPAPAPSGSTISWQPVPEGTQMQPGNVYRASAPPQNFVVMAMIPGHLASAGFTDVQIYKPGDAFPNDWPDSGNALRIQATLPATAQPQTFALDGVSVWEQVTTQTAGQVAEQVVRHVARGVYETVNRISYPDIPVPASNGVFAGLVRPRQSR